MKHVHQELENFVGGVMLESCLVRWHLLFTTTVLLGIGLVTACSQLETVERRNENGIVVERYQQTADSLRQGLYEAFDDEGTVIETAEYHAGVLQGTRTLYYASGAVQYTETHAEGEFSGPYTSYYPDGQKQLEGEYVGNKMQGIWTGYYPSGEKKEDVTFRDNEENGPFKEWYSNGATKAEGEYLGGDREHGSLILYNDNAELIRRMQCDQGICKTVWEKESEAENG